MGRRWLTLGFLLAGLVAPGEAAASSRVTYGLQDDAWLAFGPGSVEQRIGTLKQLGVPLVRYTLRWDQIATTRPKYPRWSGARAYTWGSSDRVLKALHSHHVQVVLTIWGAPRWANGGRGPSFAPTSPRSIADFAHAAARRFPWIRKWLIWNEPNQRRFLRPATPKVYVQQILNPAYTALHGSSRWNRVGGGVTAPRGAVSPVTWIRGMRTAGAKLDAYAHNPYPEHPRAESPISGGCGHCRSITMATLGRLERATSKAWGAIRLWLTEYGYQTNPPERELGVSYAAQARYVSDAALRAYASPRVDMLVQFLLWDDRDPTGWQSGLLTANGVRKPAAQAFSLPLAQASRQGERTVLWGQVRPHHGKRPYRLEQFRAGVWEPIGATMPTNVRGFFQRSVRAGRGARFRVWSQLDRASSAVLVVR